MLEALGCRIRLLDMMHLFLHPLSSGEMEYADLLKVAQHSEGL